MAGYKLILADEHGLFLEGLENLFKSKAADMYEVAAKATTGKELIEKVSTEEYDAAVFDISFVDIGHEDLIKQIKSKSLNKDIKLFIVSAYGEMNLVKTCFRLGIDGYMLKSCGFDDILSGLKDIFMGNIHLGKNIQVSPQKNLNKEKSLDAEKKKKVFRDRFYLRQALSKREIEILELLQQGYSNKKISEKLYISDHTVSVHKKHILKKLNLQKTEGLMDFIKEHDILIKNEINNRAQAL